MSEQSRIATYLQTKLGFQIPLSKKMISNEIQSKIKYYNNIDDSQLRRSSRSLLKQSDLYNHSMKSTITTSKIERTPRGKLIQKRQQPFCLDFFTYQSLLKDLPKMIHNIYFLIEEKSMVRLLKLCVKIIYIGIKEQNVILTQNVMIFFGWIYQQLGEYQLSTFFFEKCKILAKFFKNDLIMAEALLGIAKNLKKIAKNAQSIVFLKRCLQYLWRCKIGLSQSLEIQVNQQLSFNFLAIGNTKMSNYFRQRYQQGTLQQRNSTIIKLSNDIMGAFQRNVLRLNVLDDNIKVFLNVDFIQIYKTLNKLGQRQQKGADILKNIFKINFELYINNILRQNQYSEQIPLPLNPSNQQIRQKIEHHIQKRNKMKFIPPLKIRNISSSNLQKMQKITIIQDKSMQRFSAFHHRKYSLNDDSGSICKNIVSRSNGKKLISRKKIQAHFKAFCRNIANIHIINNNQQR